MANKLAKGTRFRLIGSNKSDRVLVLAEDAKIEEISDQEMVGTIIDDRENYALNIGNVDGKWNPVTGAREPDETDALAVPELGPGETSGPPEPGETSGPPLAPEMGKKKGGKKKASKKKAAKKGSKKKAAKKGSKAVEATAPAEPPVSK